VLSFKESNIARPRALVQIVNSRWPLPRFWAATSQRNHVSVWYQLAGSTPRLPDQFIYSPLSEAAKPAVSSHFASVAVIQVPFCQSHWT
jgi:hypothetical protein